MTHLCLSKLYHHWFRQWLVAWSVPSHYLNQCWSIVNWTLRNKLQSNINQMSCIFIQKSAFDNVRKMAAILVRPQCVNTCKITAAGLLRTHCHVQHLLFTRWGRVMHICVSKLTVIVSDNGLSPSHYLKQCMNIVNWTPGNKPWWNFNLNSNIFIQENAFESVGGKMVAILSWLQCVKINILLISQELPFLHVSGLPYQISMAECTRVTTGLSLAIEL